MNKLFMLPIQIMSSTLSLCLNLCLTIIGISVAILVLLCGAGLALTAFFLICIPLAILALVFI